MSSDGYDEYEDSEFELDEADDVDDTSGINLIEQYHEANKRRGLLIFPAIFVVALALVALVTLTQSRVDVTRMGVHLLLDDGRGAWPVELWPEHLDYAARVGRYVTQLVRSDDLDAEKWGRFVDLCAERGLIPIVRLATTWNDERLLWDAPPTDSDGGYATIAGKYAAFLAVLNWPEDTPLYVIVGNEPNHGSEWGGVPDPAAYTHFLMDVSAAVKSAVPDAQIINAPLDPYAPHTNGQPFENGMVYIDAESFMDAMHRTDARVWDAIDAWGSHSYPLDSASPPWEQTHQVDFLNGASNPDADAPVGGVFNRGINGYRWELYKLGRLGVNRRFPVLITETGWRTDRTDADLAAQYLDMALRGNGGRYPDFPETGWTPWLTDERVIAVTPFALDGDPSEWDALNWLEMGDDGAILGTRPIYDRAAAIFSEEK